MLYIDTIFPTVVGRAQDVDAPWNQDVDYEALKDYCEEIYRTVPRGGYGWLNDSVYSTAGTLSLLDDDRFTTINHWVERQIGQFARELKYTDNYYLKQGSMVLYTRGSSQEFHYHPGYTFSAVYYLTAPEGSSPLCLQSPSEPDMMGPKILEYNDVNSMLWRIPAVERGVVMFRSFIQHCVPPHNTDEHRIAFVYEC